MSTDKTFVPKPTCTVSSGACFTAGACSVDYLPNTPLDRVSFDDLLWAESHLPEQSRLLSLAMCSDARGVVPLCLFAGSGSGYGCGSGYGSGSGSGYGYGSGEGSGSGS